MTTQEPTCPKDELGRSRCAEFLRKQFADFGTNINGGCEINVSVAPPMFASPYGANAYTCPHGVVWWVEPTPEQQMIWAKLRIE